MTIIPTRGAPEFARLGDVGLILVVLVLLPLLVLVIELAVVFVFLRHAPARGVPSALVGLRAFQKGAQGRGGVFRDY